MLAVMTLVTADRCILESEGSKMSLANKELELKSSLLLDSVQ